MVFEKIREALAAQFEVEPESISMETSLVDDLGLDSLDVVELIVCLEDEYGVSIPDDVASTLTTVGKIVDYVEALQ